MNYLGIDLGGTNIKGGVPCSCGRRGCFEAYSSATVLIRMTKEAMDAHPESAMHAVAAAAEVVDTYVRYLACGVANIINIFFPEVIAFSGGVANQGEALLAPLREEAARIAFGQKYVKRHTRLAQCTLGYKSGVIGAALLTKQQ